MTMAQMFNSLLRQASRRLGLNVLLEQAAFVLMLGAGTSAALLLVQRALSLQLRSAWIAAIFAAAMLAAIAVLGYLNRPSTMQTALEIDARLRLRERLSTTLAMAQVKDEFAATARQEALEAAGRVSLHGHFPIKLSKRWLHAGGGWLLVAVMALCLPEMDLLGTHSARIEKQREKQETELREMK